MNRFFIVVDKRDFKKLLTLFDNQNNLKNQKFWAFSQKDYSEFQLIRKGDLIYFGKEGFASWQCSFKVSKKEKNSNLPIKLWGDDLRTKNTILTIYFELQNYLESEDSSPHIRKLSNYKPGIYKITEKIMTAKSKEQIKLSEKLHEIPEKKTVSVKQIKRDSTKVKNLKKYYQDQCQVCLCRIEIKKKKYYSEVHHLRPIGNENGEDNLKNMIVVCPNHHKEFDYCVIRISLDGKNIVDKNDKILKKLFLKKEHTLSKDNLIYQYNRELV